MPALAQGAFMSRGDEYLNQPNRTGNLTVYLFLYIPVVWAALLIAQSLGGSLPDILASLTAALENPFRIRWTEYSPLSILICTGAYIMALSFQASNQGRTRDGEEHGSAAWATPKQVNAMFAQKENKLLTRNVRLGLDTHKHRRSLNVLVIGGSGAGKSRSYVKPNILEANTNYVVTDPKSEVLMATGGYLKQKGYDIRVLNLVNLEESDGYNPFRYLRDEKDALRLVNNLIQATTPKGSHESDPFWTKSETALLQAIILMLFQEAPEYEQNFSMVMRVLEYAEVKEEDEEYDSPLDLLFQSKSIPFRNFLGEHELTVTVCSYAQNGRLAVNLLCKEEGYWEPFAFLTVNLPKEPLKANEAFIKDFDENAGLLDFVLKNQLGTLCPERGRSGFCTYPKIAFDMEKLREFDPEGTEKYLAQAQQKKRSKKSKER